MDLTPRRRMKRRWAEKQAASPSDQVESIKLRAGQIRSELQQVIYSWNHAFLESFRPMPDLEDEIRECTSELERILETPPPDVEDACRDLLQECELLSLINKVQQSVLNLELLLEGDDLVACATVVEEMMEEKDILAAQGHHLDEKVWDVLVDSITCQKCILEQGLHDMFTSALRVTTMTRGGGVHRAVQVKYHVPKNAMRSTLGQGDLAAVSGAGPDGLGYHESMLPLRDVVHAMSLVGNLNSSLRRFADQLFRDVLEPIVAASPSQAFAGEESEGPMTSTLTFRPIATPSSENRDENASRTVDRLRPLDYLAECAQFLSDRIIEELETGSGAMRKSLQQSWQALATPAVLDDILPKSIPEDQGLMEEYMKALDDKISHLDQAMASAQLPLQPSESFSATIRQHFLPHIASYVVRGRRKALLSTARDILTSRQVNVARGLPNPDLPFLTLLSGKDSNQSKVKKEKVLGGSSGLENDYGIGLPEYLVTSQAQTIVDMLHEVAQSVSAKAKATDEAPPAPSHAVHISDQPQETLSVKTDGLSALEAYQQIRDLVYLWRAVAPVYSGVGNDGSPRAAALLYNDCQYLLHHCLTVVQHLKNQLSPEFEKTAMLVDFFPDLSRLAEGTLKSMMARQQDEISRRLTLNGELVDMLLQDDVPFESIHGAFRSVQESLESLESDWKGCFSDKDYLACMGRLCTHFFKQLVDGILALPVISRDAAHVLRFLLSQCGGLSTLFRTGGSKDGQPLEATREKGRDGGGSSLLLRFCPEYQRILDVCRFLSFVSADHMQEAMARPCSLTQQETRLLTEHRQF